MKQSVLSVKACSSHSPEDEIMIRTWAWLQQAVGLVWLGQQIVHRINMHMHSLNTCEVVRITTSKPSCLWKRLPWSCKFHWLKITLCWNFYPFWFTRRPFLCEKAHAACSKWAQLSSYTESLASFPRPVQLSIICSIGILKLGGGNKTTHSVLNVNQSPACLWSPLRSDLCANT